MYLGLDIASDKANFCIRDHAGAVINEGELSQRDLARALACHPSEDWPAITRMACEYTGRLAQPWVEVCLAGGVRSFYVHSVDRRAYTRIAGQSVKTDPQDARMLSHLLYVWSDPVRRELSRTRQHLLIEASTVKEAWELRALIKTKERAQATSVAAKLRAISAARAGNEKIAQAWEEAAKSRLSEIALEEAVAFAKLHFAKQLADLQSIPGVGEHTACMLIAYLWPPERFIASEGGRDRSLGALKKYSGMYPRVMASGQSADRERMAKTGNRPVRAAAFMAALQATTGSGQLSNLYKRLISVPEPKPRKALQVVAIRILQIAHQVMLTGKEYVDPTMPKVVKLVKPEGLLSQVEASRELGVSRQRVHQLIHEGKLPTVTWEGKRLVKQEHVQAIAGGKAVDIQIVVDHVTERPPAEEKTWQQPDPHERYADRSYVHEGKRITVTHLFDGRPRDPVEQRPILTDDEEIQEPVTAETI